MSQAASRQEIADALNAGDAPLTAYARRPRTVKAGDAYPMWAGMERTAQGFFADTWRVMVALSADEQTADAWIDEHWPALEDALSEVMFVTGFAPAAESSDAGDLLYLAVTGIKEG